MLLYVLCNYDVSKAFYACPVPTGDLGECQRFALRMLNGSEWLSECCYATLVLGDCLLARVKTTPPPMSL